MKKQLSKRIGAILTMTAMLMTLLPMAIPVMATEGTSENPNLITNGDFTDGLNGWTKVGTASYVTEYSDTENIYEITVPAVKLVRRNHGVSQIVKDLTGDTSYQLSMSVVNIDTSLNSSVVAEVEFGKYDETTSEFTRLDALSNTDGLMLGGLVGAGSSSDITSSVKLRILSDATGTKCTRTLNFNLPPAADAVNVKLTGYAGSKSTANAVIIDDIVLEKCSADIEMINNGSFLTMTNNVTQGWKYSNGADAANGVANASTADSYVAISDNLIRQPLSLRYGKVYKLSFRFAHSGSAEKKAPSVSLSVLNTNGINKTVDIFANCVGVEASTADNMKPYEAYIILDKPADDYAFSLVNSVISLRNEDTDTVYYDNISLVEVNDTTQMAFAAGKNGQFTTEAADVKVASCIFVQGETPTIQKFIVAKYNSTTHALESASVVNAGEGIAAGNAKRYDVEIADDASSYYRIFLFDGKTLAPILNSQEIGK